MYVHSLISKVKRALSWYYNIKSEVIFYLGLQFLYQVILNVLDLYNVQFRLF